MANLVSLTMCLKTCKRAPISINHWHVPVSLTYHHLTLHEFEIPKRGKKNYKSLSWKFSCYLPVDADPIRAVVVMFGVGDALQGTLGRQTGQTMSVKVPFGWQVTVTGWSLFPGMYPEKIVHKSHWQMKILLISIHIRRDLWMKL